ncbi:MAG TPA: hypothetical protein VIL53_06065 [Solirubrobacterales bacterium]
MARKLTDPLAFAAAVLLVIVAFLGVDHFATASAEFAIGAATWALLLAACLPLTAEERSRVALVVLVATAVEVLGSIVLCAYVYRLGNLPAFVPPGHGLVYLAGLRISQSAPVLRRPRAFAGAAATVVVLWGAAGLLLLDRTDLLGALAGIALVTMLVRGRAPTLYAGVFLIVAFLELYGTAIGAWHWAEAVPGTPVGAGNPPSGIASIYVLFDIAAITLAPRLLAAMDSVRRLPPLLHARRLILNTSG